MSASSIYDFTLKTIEGEAKSLSDFKGKVLLVVNVASQCGLTPQYAELELFYCDMKAKGVEVLGFPANNFGGQEPGTDTEIREFCSARYNVSFPMFSKISVKGADQHPLYTYLTGQTASEMQWNFQKFLVGKDGKVISSFAPTASVEAPEVRTAVEAAL